MQVRQRRCWRRCWQLVLATAVHRSRCWCPVPAQVREAGAGGAGTDPVAGRCRGSAQHLSIFGAAARGEHRQAGRRATAANKRRKRSETRLRHEQYDTAGFDRGDIRTLCRPPGRTEFRRRLYLLCVERFAGVAFVPPDLAQLSRGFTARNEQRKSVHELGQLTRGSVSSQQRSHRARTPIARATPSSAHRSMARTEVCATPAASGSAP